MAAIFGIYNIDSKEVENEYSSKMVDNIKIYSFDKLKCIKLSHLYFGCGTQYNTPESYLEELPRYDNNYKLLITADAIIDNRQQLLEIFNIVPEIWDKTTDSELILSAYEKWQEDSPKHLIGDFAFIIWDKDKNKLFCARDHVGKRTLYYYKKDNIFAFSTIINPLFAFKKLQLNERWITDYLALDGILHAIESKETVYEDVFQLQPASTITVTENGLTEKCYWKPLENIKQLKFSSSEQYDEAFRKVFFEAVNCRVRSAGKVAIMLSGGLDSSSIACIAAKKLAKTGEKLKAFSSIPIDEYKSKLQKCFLTNESEYIKTISDAYDNISIEYCKSENYNSFLGIDDFVNILEQPYKIFQNIFWYNNFVKKAYEEGCNILLNGQSGNSTISYGEFTIHAKTLFKKGKIITLIREVDALSKEVRMPKKKIWNIILRVLTPYRIRKIVSSNITNPNYDKFSSVMISKELLEKWKVKERFSKEGYNDPVERYYDLQQNHKYMVDPLAFSHIATIETKLTLANRVTIRDPSRDKRVIEFCLSVPSQEFVKDGKERLLIRRALKGILPDKIRLNTSKHGVQSADWIERLKPYWKDIKIELNKLFKPEGLITKYVDLEKAKKELEQIGEDLVEENEESLRRLFIILVFARFLKGYERR
ncbi:asparagine synthase-related protein [Clostridium akagii]|uniref:asparagine synthase-related protein n=1 Tax=Clostridium akagii TaxID=91623 RepID=UPI00047C2370|nr:asparagine synthase-related protein [Clostridium akagii]